MPNLFNKETQDAFLGGRLTVRQPATGHRAGSDAVFLAAAVPAQMGDRVLELGTGVGAALLCVASRISDMTGIGVDIDPAAVALAEHNIRDNGFAGRLKVFCADLLLLPLEVRTGGFDHVFANPPFFDEAKAQKSPDPTRRLARSAESGAIMNWLRTASTALMENGLLTLIYRTERISELLTDMPEDFGPVTLFPLFSGIGKPAKRTIVQARKSAGRQIWKSPGMVLHQPGGAYTPAAEQVLRFGAALKVERGDSDVW